MIVFRALLTTLLAVKGEKCGGGEAKCPKKDLECYCVGIWYEKWNSLSWLEKQQNLDVSRT
jgi:hypothetical protein